MKNKRLQSSLGTSKYFDGGLHPCAFFGINSEFSKRKGTTNEERTVYFTCSFNLPRVALQLDSSYLEPTSRFIEAIDNVLRDPTLWAKSVVDHTLWRVIEYDDFESVICLLKQQQQDVVKEIIGSNVGQLSNTKMHCSRNTKKVPFQGDGTPYEFFNNFMVDFQGKLRSTQEKMNIP